MDNDNSLVAQCTWERPDCPPNTALTYHMEVDEGGEGSADFHEVYCGPAPNHTLALKPGRSYKFRIRAGSSTGSSPWSVIKGFSRSGPGMGVPEHVTGTVLDDGSAVFAWSPPSGVLATAYQVKLDLQEGKKRRDVDGFEYRRDDLSEGVHRFQVRSMLNGKWSEWSREVLINIPAKDGGSSPSFQQPLQLPAAFQAPAPPPPQGMHAQPQMHSQPPTKLPIHVQPPPVMMDQKILRINQPPIPNVVVWDSSIEQDLSKMLDEYGAGSAGVDLSNFPQMLPRFNISPSEKLDMDVTMRGQPLQLHQQQPPPLLWGADSNTDSLFLGGPRGLFSPRDEMNVSKGVVGSGAVGSMLLRCNGEDSGVGAFEGASVGSLVMRGNGEDSGVVDFDGVKDSFRVLRENSGNDDSDTFNKLRRKSDDLVGSSGDCFHLGSTGFGSSVGYSVDSDTRLQDSLFSEKLRQMNWGVDQDGDENEGDELISSIPFGLLDELDGGTDPSLSTGFYNHIQDGAGTTPSSVGGLTKFSLWGTPLDLPLDSGGLQPASAPSIIDIPKATSGASSLFSGHVGSSFNADSVSSVGAGVPFYGVQLSSSNTMQTSPHAQGAGMVGFGLKELGQGTSLNTPLRGVWDGMEIKQIGLNGCGAAVAGSVNHMDLSSSGKGVSSGPSAAGAAVNGGGNGGIGVGQYGGLAVASIAGGGAGAGVGFAPVGSNMTNAGHGNLTNAGLGGNMPNTGMGVGNMTNTGMGGNMPNSGIGGGNMTNAGIGGGGNMSGAHMSAADIAAELINGSCLTMDDLDSRHRELLSGLTREEAFTLIDNAKPQLVNVDKMPMREQAAFLHSTLQKSRHQARRGGNGISQHQQIAGRIMRQPLYDVCAGTSFEPGDFDKQDANMLASAPFSEAVAMIRLVKSKLQRVHRPDVRNLSAFLHDVVATSREEVRRGIAPRSHAHGQNIGQHHQLMGQHQGINQHQMINQQQTMSQQQGMTQQQQQQSRDSMKDVGATGNSGGMFADLQPAVRKCVKDLVSQTCFEDLDFERAHVSLLAGMVPGLACVVLKTVKSRLTKMKRKEFRNPSASLLGALSSAARAACATGGGGAGMGASDF